MKIHPVCPSCASTQVKEIVYGLPDIENFDFDRKEVGGCCISEQDPIYKCSKCANCW